MTGRSGLRRFVGDPGTRPAPTPPADERCEMCAKSAGPRHGHVVDIEKRALLCTCRPCYLLFTREAQGAAGGRYRAVPERVLHDPARPLTPAEWEGLGVPVGSAFFLRGDKGIAAFYPSPAGATESLLDLDRWAELGAAHPMLDTALPEVEAILVRGGERAVECYLVPIDVCYELVGTVRRYWKGFDGGQEARQRIDECFARIRAAAQEFDQAVS